ncbi:hypothetical protein [Salegentibacter mishustinae]|uniref:Uncharacterized protein n=1 Tax=Salegentibacter mishustinae TaxID=270918 RepID=A0A0Q9Z8B3_9FLAO|nr:hypothetical protein [Salegentibacter mishustinae]KRG28249.1 hypothetical protein APR42_05535 [Salegentibacter mishustinae]PNW22184.1 hypothetical protein APB85_13300 [Salegentibacter mishustinae]PZX67403.1 hypothetical protein LY54_00133 [Salegentibacter mishustinae]GGW80003.1 hypothetical protein GCM10008086_04730 [Salegentibacter mishustinae]
MKPASTYSEISEGALLLHQQIVGLAKENPEIQSLYKGCQLLFSPLLERPKILLIGYNPGGGYFNWHGEIMEEFTQSALFPFLINMNTNHETRKKYK